MKLLQKLQQKIADAGDAVRKLNTLDRELREAHAAALARADEIAAAPPPVEDIVANARRVVDQIGADVGRDWRYSLVASFGGSVELNRDGSLTERPPQVPQLAGFHGLRFEDICALMPEQIKASLERIIRSEPINSPGPLSDRQRLLDACQADIRALEDQHEEMCVAAHGMTPPIPLEFLSTVRVRREATAARAQREKVDREARRQIEERINQRHAARRG